MTATTKTQTIETSTLRPGLLVSLKTSLRGNVSYETRDLETGEVITPQPGGKRRKKGEQQPERKTVTAKWETTRTIEDAAEFERGSKARGAARKTIERVCTNTAFGLLCPEENADVLAQALADARKIAADFNATASVSRLVINVISGRVAQDDVEAVKAINAEVRELMEEMQAGLKALDADRVREAASKAKQLGAMLKPDAEAKVRIAIDAARESAKKIVAAGETAALEVDTVTIRKIAGQRTAFLDLDEAKEVAAPKAAAGRGVDLAPTTVAQPKRQRRAAAEV